MRPFLAFCRDKRPALDFLSWHAYYGVPQYLVHDAVTARKLLDEYGFPAAESHLNEWRYPTTWSGLRPSDAKQYKDVPEWFGRSCRAEGAAFWATVFLKLQDCPLDVANFYSADTSPWSMFGQFGVPTKVYYAFRAFQELRKTPNRVACEELSAGDPLTLCAGVSEDRQSAVVLVSNFQPRPRELAVALRNLPWTGETSTETYRVDAVHDLERTGAEKLKAEKAGLRLEIPGWGLCLVRLSQAGK